MKRAFIVVKFAAIGLLALAALQAGAQTAPAPAQLTGTLAKVRDSGTITIGHRESSIPFSYRSVRGEPIGYSIDLCKLLVDAISEEVGRDIAIKWQPVTSESRIPAVVSGQVDLECGSTTSNLERQKQVSFSPTMFVSGTKLMVKKGSPIKSFRDLAGKKVVVTAGTTNEKTMRELAVKFKIDMILSVAADHAASFAQLQAGQVDAFATDDVLLYGFIATDPKAKNMKVVGDFLSYDPYGLMLRNDDPQFAALVERTFQRIAGERRLAELYNKWFLRRLPTGETLNLPISPQLEELFRVIGQPD